MPELIIRHFVRTILTHAMAWMSALVVIEAAGQRALGQPSPPNDLQPGEALVDLNFGTEVNSKPAPPNEEGARTTETATFNVRASFAARYIASGPGKRRLSAFRLLSPDRVAGSLSEVHTYIKPFQVGEGGLNADPAQRSEVWKASEVPVSLPQFDIEIDLDAKTWIIREFGDAPQTWFAQLTKAQSYFGLVYDVDFSDGVRKWKPIAIPRVPGLNREALALAEPAFQKLAEPQVLNLDGANLRGSAGFNRFKNAAFSGAWWMIWSIREASSELELQVTAQGYEEWRPKVKDYDPDRRFITPGEPLSVTVMVVDPARTNPAVRIKSIPA